MMDNNNKNAYVRQVAEQKYEFGFTTDVHTDIIEKGLSEDVVRLISVKKGEPEWLLAFRLQAFRYWQTLKQPSWGHVRLPEIDYQAISYYADPLAKKPKNKEIDPEMEKTFEKLGRAFGIEWNGSRCHYGLRFGENDIQGKARRERNYLLFNRRSR